MPAPNDLTPEEEAAFVEHGVQPAGPGAEPVIENEGDIQAQVGEPLAAEPVAAAPAVEPPVVSRHREDGTFKTQAEFEADIAAAEATAVAAPPAAADAQPRMVPHQALHEARERAAANARQAQLATARLNAILTANGGGEQPLAMPDINEDPAGYVQALEQRLSQFENTAREDQQYRQIDNALEEDEALFSQQVPDYQAASDHYVRSRAQELLAFNTPQDAQKIMVQEARAIANQSWQRGMSAGHTIYQLAQARGYVPGNTAANPNLAPIPPRPAAQPAPVRAGITPQAQVAAITNAQERSRSLSGGGGAASTGQLNAEAILAMDDAEFEQYLGIGKKGADQRFAAIG